MDEIMAFRDLLLPLTSYPDSPSAAALANAAVLAERLGGEVTALALRIDIKPMNNRLANALIGMDKMIADAEAASETRALTCLQDFKAQGEARGLVVRTLVEQVPLYGAADRLRLRARTYDLTLMSIAAGPRDDRAIAEALLFGSGRPILIYPQEPPLAQGPAFGTIAIAWDGEPAAARAVANALPVLRAAGQVRVLTVVGEKSGIDADTAKDLLRHLARHGIAAVVDAVEAGDAPIGQVFGDYVAARKVDLLVMGGFGHSRAREFVLGGATRAVLGAPPCPILMSH